MLKRKNLNQRNLKKKKLAKPRKEKRLLKRVRKKPPNLMRAVMRISQ